MAGSTLVCDYHHHLYHHVYSIDCSSLFDSLQENVEEMFPHDVCSWAGHVTIEWCHPRVKINMSHHHVYDYTWISICMLQHIKYIKIVLWFLSIRFRITSKYWRLIYLYYINTNTFHDGITSLSYFKEKRYINIYYY